jgi:serine/threonine-protein kinase RsbW
MQHNDHRRDPDQPRESTDFVLQLPSDLKVIEDAVTYLVNRCRNLAYGGSRLDLNFRVGVTEALANAILYGNKGDPSKKITVDVSLDRTRVALRVVDEGNGFDARNVPDPTLPANLRSSKGRGIFLLRKLMDEVEFNERGNEVRMVLLREPPADAASASE